MRLAALILAIATPTLASCAANPAAASTAQLENPQAIVDELLAADRAISASGSGTGLIESLTAMFGPDVIMPLPNGTFARGKEAAAAALRTNPANLTAKAIWAPVRGGISADGQHGFTYGFMTITDAGKPDRRAKYLAYWVKGAEGWRVAAYKRGFSPEGPVVTTPRPPAIPAAMTAPTTAEAINVYRASMMAAEKAFSDRAQVIGLGPAFTEFGSADAMNMGPDPDFLYGNVAIGGARPSDGTISPVYWSANFDALVASSGDLGVNFGYIKRHKPPPEGQPTASAFFTVWHRATPQASWRYIAE